MLILSTKLIDNEELTHTAFVQMVVDWLSGNHNYGFDTVEYPHQLPMVLDCEKDHLEIMENIFQKGFKIYATFGLVDILNVLNLLKQWHILKLHLMH